MRCIWCVEVTSTHHYLLDFVRLSICDSLALDAKQGEFCPLCVSNGALVVAEIEFSHIAVKVFFGNADTRPSSRA